jgi:hypothetical protein
MDITEEHIYEFAPFAATLGVRFPILAANQVQARRPYLPHHPALRRLIAKEFQDRLQGAGIDATVAFLERRKND